MGQDLSPAIASGFGLVAHNFHELAATDEYSGLGVLVGLEADVYVVGESSSSAWRATAAKHSSTQLSPEAVAAVVNRWAGQGMEVYLDVKCPRDATREGQLFTESLRAMTSDCDGLFLISRNHSVLRSAADAFNVGPILADGIIDVEEYLVRLKARLVVTSRMHVDRELVARLASLDIGTVLFPVDSKSRLLEAEEVGPFRIMVERRHISELRTETEHASA